LNDDVKRVLELTDRVLLDIKYTDENSYVKYVGCTLDKPLQFLSFLNERGIATTLRQVTIPTLNDTESDVLALKNIAANHACVDKIELLPFRKICQVKYDSMGLVFPFGDIPEPTHDTMVSLNALLQK
jgi:pyruvate formate lyase activating enzyme